MEYKSATGVFEVLADPTRRRMLDALRGGERPVGELVGLLGISQPAVSKQLRSLREAGLVEVRRHAQRRLYRVRAEPLRAVDEWLAPYRWMWEARLDALEDHLDTMAADEAGDFDEVRNATPTERAEEDSR